MGLSRALRRGRRASLRAFTELSHICNKSVACLDPMSRDCLLTLILRGDIDAARSGSICTLLPRQAIHTTFHYFVRRAHSTTSLLLMLALASTSAHSCLPAPRPGPSQNRPLHQRTRITGAKGTDTCRSSQVGLPPNLKRADVCNSAFTSLTAAISGTLRGQSKAWESLSHVRLLCTDLNSG